MAPIIRVIACVLVFGLVNNVAADDQRARNNYMIHCQGCHLPEAEGLPGKVPRMKNFLGYFLHSQAGRQFIIRVPGVSTSALQDDQVTELMNWLLFTYSAPQLPESFVPFTVDEIAALRQDIELDPETTRRVILERIAARVAGLQRELDAEEG